MKRIVLIIAIGCMMQTTAVAQNMQTVIKTQALEMARALGALDLEKYASYSWPALVNDAKSKEMLKQGADSTEKYRKQYGIKVKSIIIGNPSAVITHKNVMQCTISQNLTVEAMIGSVTTENILIGLSNDGAKWYFVDANFFKSAQTKDKLPELSPKLVIPDVKPPVVLGADGKPIKQ